MEIFDTHCHLADPKIYPKHKEVIKRAKDNGVTRILTIGYDDKTNDLSIKIAQKNEGVWAAVGIHPNESYDKEIILSLEEKVVAVGETGLDYYRNNTDRDTQIERFLKHISIARSRNLPIIIHTRKAFPDAIMIVKEEKYPNGVFHCFSGNCDDARKIIDLGFYISFSGSLTYGSTRLSQVLKSIPTDRILFETDSPYLSPIRSEMNEPKNVVKIIEYASNVLGVAVEELALINTENGRRLFAI